jgi:hypothetical protein
MANAMAMDANNNKIFRYKLSDAIMLCIAQFAKIHEDDDRHTYKEAWSIWLNENHEQIDREVYRLQQLNYQGDILDKMFKAGRYYFREKLPVEKKEKKKGEKQREYIVMEPELIQAMDAHLRLAMNATNFKPALAYQQFCTQHLTLLRTEINRLVFQNIPGEKITAKLKKTYKNRYFVLKP